MIVTRSWLQEWIDISNIETKKIIEKLNSIGLEVAEYKKIDIPSKVVIGKVLECEKHPNANKLSICKVDIGTDIKQIVCGAKNVAKDQFVAVATIGAKLPNGLEIKPVKLRGIDSEGMICSSTEIGLPELENGIMVLDDSIGKLELGKELKEYEIVNDEIIEIELTANRGDCLSIYGVARELSAAFNLSIKTLEDLKQEKNEKMQIGIGRVLKINHKKCDADLIYKVFSYKDYQNPFIIKIRLAFIDENLKNEIENLVFYATYSVGTILRGYSYNIFKQEESALIEIRQDENRMDSLYSSNGKKVSIVGINQIKESLPKEEDFFIVEASYINPTLLAKKYYEASKKEKIDVDWVYYRSSRGTDPNLHFGISYFCKLIEKYSDIDIFSGEYEILQEKEKKIINININNISKLIGFEISYNDFVNVLKKLGFEIIKNENENMAVKIPLFRHDIENEQDIAEEYLRFFGIDNIEPKPFEFREKNRINISLINFKKRKNLRNLSIARGFYETISYMFAEKSRLKKYGLKTIKDDLDLINPITNELNTLRTSIVPGLLEQCEKNIKNGKKRVKLFEIGAIFDENRDERLSFTLIFSGNKEEENISNQGKPQEVDFEDFIKDLASIIGDFKLIPCEPQNGLMHPYQSASIVKNGEILGKIYKLHNLIQKELELPATYICELEFDKIPYGLKEAKEYSKFQISFRDISILIDKNIEFFQIENVLKDSLPKDVQRFYPIDIYESEKLGDKKSLTIRFVIQPKEKTLSEEEISSIIDKILEKLKKELNVELR